MKKPVIWVLIIAFFGFFIDWVVLGIKILNGNYDVIAEAYIGAVCFVIMLVCLLIKKFSSKCPHCGKISDSGGRFCPHCGKTIE